MLVSVKHISSFSVLGLTEVVKLKLLNDGVDEDSNRLKVPEILYECEILIGASLNEKKEVNKCCKNNKLIELITPMV